MNGDRNHEGPEPWSDPAHEARIVAWVLGEASGFEMADLQRLVSEHPELAAFKQRIEWVHGLLGVAAKPDAEPWTLSPERRAALAKLLGPLPASAVVKRPDVARRAARKVLLMMAACVAASVVLVKLVWSGGASDVAALAGGGRHDESVDERAEPIGAEFDKREAWSDRDGENKALRLADLPVPAPAAPGQGQGEGYGYVSGGGGGGGGFSTPAASADPLPERRELADLSVGLGRGRGKGKGGAGTPQPGVGNATGEGEGMTGGKDLAKEDGRARRMPAHASRPLSSTTSVDDLAGATGKAQADGQVADSLRQSNQGLAPMDGAGIVRRDDGDKAAAAPAAEVAKPKVATPGTPATPGKPGKPGKPAEVAEVAEPAVLDEVLAAVQPVSTFSLNVSDVSFQLAAQAIANNERPDPGRVRVEEFYNAFDYNDPAPSSGEKVALNVEQSAHPFAAQRNLVRVAMKTASQGRAAGQPLHLTVLLDTSGSMEREDRAATVQRAFASLAGLLGPNDIVNVVGFARQPRLLAERVTGDQAGSLVELVRRTPSQGGTNLEEALKLGGELAQRQFAREAQNRIVLMTDGAANLGDAVPAQLANMIAGLRQAGIAFDACGIGSATTGDEMLEALARRGDGRYYHLGNAADADAGFAQKLAGAFRPAAQDVKVQVRFNPERVGNYRLVGFDNHRLAEEDFRNNAVDAAELAADEAGVAIYEVEPLANGEGELGEVAVRFLDTSSGQIVERSMPLRYLASVPPFDQAPASLQLAGTAAMLGEYLRGGAPGARVELSELTPVANHLRGAFANDRRVAILLEMFARLNP